MKYLLPILICFTSCINEPDKQQQQQLEAIHQQLVELNDSLQSLKDSIRKKADDLPTIEKKDTAVKIPPQKVEKITQKPNPPTPQQTPKPQPQVPLPKNDTIYHYYINKKVSVMITPWKDGERKLYFYDLYGNNTFDIDEIRHSYSQSVDLHFEKNGSVSKAVVDLNPGASMYWYKSEITFTTTNEPLWRTSQRMPYESVEDALNNKPEYWDKRERIWKKQQVME
ncbi:MAG: hypothetical protein SFW35_13595 [Chitinophagales bacterium]|nr:hypothetical protein [Chitinophagales bacterium]